MATEETPEEKFMRLANVRVQKALKAIEQLGNLKTSAYKHDKRVERFAQIKKALIEAVNEAIPTKEEKEPEPKPEFVLK
jgi:hypothetical protein